MKRIRSLIANIFFVKYFRNKIVLYKGREREVHYGDENEDKTFYVIGMDDTVAGLFWLINKSLMHIAYAHDKDYIPVIDLQNYKTQYQTPELFGIENIWEYYFEQPMGYDLDAIKNSRNVILAKKYYTPDQAHFMGNFYEDKRRINYFHILFEKYIIYNKRTQDYFDKSYNEIIANKGNVLGVLCRGTDYVISKPKGHPIPPSAEQVIRKVQEIRKVYNCKYIFLATEDADVYDCFYKEFKSDLLANDQIRTDRHQIKEGTYLSKIRLSQFRTKEDKYMSGLKYLTAIYLLSKCNCFIGSRCGGTKGVLMMTKGFEYEYIFNLGMY